MCVSYSFTTHINRLLCVGLLDYTDRRIRDQDKKDDQGFDKCSHP